MEKMAESGNAIAIYNLGVYYSRGDLGMPRDTVKANELYLKTGELGYAAAYYNLGIVYHNGRGVEVDEKKSMHYYELAAMNGDVCARYNLGSIEGKAGNYDRAYKHHILAAKAGFNISLVKVKEGFMKGYVTKDEYADTLRAYQQRQDEMKSDDRDRAEVVGKMRTTLLQNM